MILKQKQKAKSFFSTSKLNTLAYYRVKGFGISTFFVGLLVIFTLIIPIIRAAPSVKEYWAIKQAVRKAVFTASSEDDVRRSFQAQIPIDNIRAIGANDLIINEVAGQLNVRFNYQQPIPLYGNTSLLIQYGDEVKGASKIS